MRSVRAIGWTDVDEADRALAELCSAGDEQACRTLVADHERMVHALALQLLGNHDEALDLSQDVFLRVFRSIHRFRGASSLRTWIYRIVINGARNKRRWWQRRCAWQVPLDAGDGVYEPPAVDDPSSPDRVLDRKDLGQRLWRSLRRLPLEQRSAIILREMHGMRYTEIAYALGITTSAVKSRLARARARLRRELRP